MRKLIVFFAIAASFHSFANSTHIEFDDAIEEKCHAEIKKLNCTSKTDEEISECVESKKVKLSKDCKSMHDTKMKNK
jgi:hypothetical protein